MKFVPYHEMTPEPFNDFQPLQNVKNPFQDFSMEKVKKDIAPLMNFLKIPIGKGSEEVKDDRPQYESNLQVFSAYHQRVQSVLSNFYQQSRKV